MSASSSSQLKGGSKQHIAARLRKAHDQSVDRSRSPQRPEAKSKGGARAHALQQSRADECYKDDAGESADDAVPDPEAFRAHVKHLFLRNKCSGLETQALTAAATKSGAVGVQDFASTGNAGKLAKNIHRDLMRKLLKGNKMPDLYWAQIPCSDPKTGEKKTMAWLPFLLVHEFLVLLAKTTSMDELVCFPEGSGLQEFQDEFASKNKHIDNNLLIAIGLHGDGVAHKRKDTVEAFTWNFPTLPRQERYLFGSVEKHYLCGCGCKGRCTYEGILSVFAWCMRSLFLGQWPNARHDKSKWLRSDKKRSAQAKEKFGFWANLTQVRGDWMFYKTVFSFKGWASNSICWLCKANKSDIPFTEFFHSGPMENMSLWAT